MVLRSHGHRSTHIAALALATALACHKDAVVTTRTVTAFVPQGFALGGNVLAFYTALGDYDKNPPDTGHLLSAVGTSLTEIDTNARELLISANDETSAGLAPVPDSGDVNVLVLPQFTPCPFTNRVGARTGSTLAAIGDNRVMLVGGNGTTVPVTYVADLTTGVVAPVTHDVTTARVGATVTSFGDGALVAGGVSVDGPVSNTAEVYSAALGGFDPSQTVTLDGPRAFHAAVTLYDGRTLLVGGSSDAKGMSLLKTLYVATPGQRTSTETGVATLVTPRLNPIVVRLASGEILVAGGKDANGNGVTTMEWLSPDATLNAPQKAQPWADAPFTMTALDGGGALVVESRFNTTWIVGASYDIQQVTNATLPTLVQPVLFGGAGGAPVLWTGGHFVRWQPWPHTWGAFETLGSGPLAIPGDIVSPDPGLAMWFDSNLQKLVAMRFDTRNAYSELQGPGGTVGAVDFTTDMSPDEQSSQLVSFDPATGIKVTEFGRAFVTDRTYEDVTVHVTSPSDPGPCVVLRTTSGQEVILPDPTSADGGTGLKPGQVLDVQRTGANVSFSINGGPFIASTSSIGVGNRVAVGVQGFPGSSGANVTDIRITRPGTP